MAVKTIKKGTIYKITCKITGTIYIGSTTKTIEQRLRQHEINYKSYLNNKYHYVTSFDIIEGNDYKIELIEELLNTTKGELLKKENEYIESIECINKNKPHTGLDLNEYQKQYRNDNKDKINERAKEKFTCICGGKYTYASKAMHEKTKTHQYYMMFGDNHRIYDDPEYNDYYYDIK